MTASARGSAELRARIDTLRELIADRDVDRDTRRVAIEQLRRLVPRRSNCGTEPPRTA